MKYDQFEDLPAWNAAIELKLDIDLLCQVPAVARLRNWVDQIDRASLSISNNIAEGFERGTTNELLAFLYIARGSAGEVRSMLRYAHRRPDMKHVRCIGTM
jgi:four helix bundle protein